MRWLAALAGFALLCLAVSILVMAMAGCAINFGERGTATIGIDDTNTGFQLGKPASSPKD